MGQLRSELAYTAVVDMMNGGLYEFLDALQDKLNGVGHAIFETFIILESEPASESKAMLSGFTCRRAQCRES